MNNWLSGIILYIVGVAVIIWASWGGDTRMATGIIILHTSIMCYVDVKTKRD